VLAEEWAGKVRAAGACGANLEPLHVLALATLLGRPIVVGQHRVLCADSCGTGARSLAC